MDNNDGNTDIVDGNNNNNNNNNNFNRNKLIRLQKASFLRRVWSLRYIPFEQPVLEITVGHQTFSNLFENIWPISHYNGTQ